MLENAPDVESQRAGEVEKSKTDMVIRLYVVEAKVREKEWKS